MTTLRFGQVASVLNYTMEEARQLKSPCNRVLFCQNDNRAYLVTGPEDITMVDELMNARKAVDPKEPRGTFKISTLSNSLIRFLWNRSSNMQIRDNLYSHPQIDLL